MVFQTCVNSKQTLFHSLCLARSLFRLCASQFQMDTINWIECLRCARASAYILMCAVCTKQHSTRRAKYQEICSDCLPKLICASGVVCKAIYKILYICSMLQLKSQKINSNKSFYTCNMVYYYTAYWIEMIRWELILLFDSTSFECAVNTRIANSVISIWGICICE